MLEIFQGTKIGTTKIDRTKIKPVLNLIRLRYVSDDDDALIPINDSLSAWADEIFIT